MTDWLPDLSRSDKPRYLAIADALAEDVARGVLAVGDRLPPQRKLAHRLRVDFTTVARGYVEAQRRGLVTSRVGQGSFVTARPEPGPKARRGADPVDLSMNLPPEPDAPALVERMRAGLDAAGRDLVALLRYQAFGGSTADKEAASAWLGRRSLVPAQHRVFIAPGAHAALMGIFGTLARPGDTILSEAITYPGAATVAGTLGLTLVGLPMDDGGIEPAALSAACAKHAPKALYLNPTLQNPTTLTMSERRREEVAAIARRWKVPIVEDDAYGFLAPHAPAPIAAIAPDVTFHIAGLAKMLGAGLRVAYVVAPDAKSGWAFAAALRAATVMASPLTVAVATRWIEDGTAEALVRFVREESAARQAIVREVLPLAAVRTDPTSFHLWLTLPEGWTRAAFIGRMRTSGVGVVASDPFTVAGPPPEAVRIGLGGPASRDTVRHALEYAAHALNAAPTAGAGYL